MFPLLNFGKRQFLCIVVSVVWLTFLPAISGSADKPLTLKPMNQGTLNSGKLKLISGKSIVLRSSKPVKRVSIADPEIADILMLSPRELYLIGKKPGSTNLALWHNNRLSGIYDLEVSYDLSQMKRHIHRLFPEETQLQVIGTPDSVTLAGKVTSSASLSKVLALAKFYVPESRISNLIEVGGVHQVMLEVRIAEMSRSDTKRLGINFNYVNGVEFGANLLSGLSTLGEDDGTSFSKLLVSPNVNAISRFTNGSSVWTLLIDALKEEGLVKILAEPTLTTLSGRKAEFLAGGEFPVPIPDEDGIAIEYRQFGVGLSFTPTVIDKDKISIEVNPEVSELDFSTSMKFSGFVVPGISTRRVSTTIELADGQSFAIAGLLHENIRDQIQKFPYLGDIPILGTLFRSHSFIKNETELIIIVTPHLAKPLDMGKQTLPTDHYIMPNDREFYLKGLQEGKGLALNHPTHGKLDGDFGHSTNESE